MGEKIEIYETNTPLGLYIKQGVIFNYLEVEVLKNEIYLLFYSFTLTHTIPSRDRYLDKIMIYIDKI